MRLSRAITKLLLILCISVCMGLLLQVVNSKNANASEDKLTFVDVDSRSYTVGTGKVTVLILGRPSCLNTYYTTQGIAESGWVNSDDIQVVFADIDGNTVSTIKSFRDEMDCKHIMFCAQTDSVIGSYNSLLWNYVSDSVTLPVIVYFDKQGNQFDITTAYMDSSEILSVIKTLSDIVGFEGVEIDGLHFPDANFRTILLEGEYGADGFFSRQELLKVTDLYIGDKNISDLTGIEYFTKLKYLYCYGNQLTCLDLRNNTSLIELWCSGNKLTKLDTSNNTALNKLFCADNQLVSLDISLNTNLIRLSCENNRLNKLDVSKNTSLESLVCTNNKITSLDISCCPYLVKVYSEYGLDYMYKYDSFDYLYLSTDPYVQIITTAPTPSALPSPTSSPVSIRINSDKVEIACDKKVCLDFTVGGTSENLEWKSSDPQIASVDKHGCVKAKKAGQVIITASIAGERDSCKVTVLYKDVTDTKDFWYIPTNYLTAKGVVKGYADQTEFRPANKCTRAQMVTFIWRLQGEPAPKSKTCKFTDVEKSDYFYKACIWGNENHIVEGYKDGTFGPQVICARKHAVTFLWRLAGKPDPKSSNNKFTDVKKNDYYYKATLWASEKKILAGYDDDTFRPNGDCLRRQMVTFLYKYDRYVNGK